MCSAYIPAERCSQACLTISACNIFMTPRLNDGRSGVTSPLPRRGWSSSVLGLDEEQKKKDDEENDDEAAKKQHLIDGKTSSEDSDRGGAVAFAKGVDAVAG